MSLAVNIALKKTNRTYSEGDVVSGMVLIDSKAEGKHDGIMLSLEGVLNIQMSMKNSGLLDSLVQTTKPVILASHAKEICRPGKLSAGRTQIPFAFPLAPRPNKVLHETFHGMHVVIQYTLRCEVRRSLLSKGLVKTQEICVQSKPGDGVRARPLRREFEIRPESLQKVRERTRIPRFLVVGCLESTELLLSRPVVGELSVKECERGISSIELQLVRVETCGTSEVSSREVSEVENIQLCSGDVPRGVTVPIHMILPRLFTCVTVIAPTFKIEFELNVIIIFDNDHLVMESIPVTLMRY